MTIAAPMALVAMCITLDVTTVRTNFGDVMTMLVRRFSGKSKRRPARRTGGKK